MHPGNYTICEVLRTGWHNIMPAGLHPTYNQPCYTQTINPGETVEFLFGNSTTPPASGVAPSETGGNVLVSMAKEDKTADEEGAENSDVVPTDDAWLNAEEPEDLIHTVFLPVVSR